MKERPILFSAPMVRAILDGSKTQTRRVVKPQPGFGIIGNGSNGTILAKNPAFGHQNVNGGRWINCPYGQAGDQLWVRETWRIGAWSEDDGEIAVDYLADNHSRHEWLQVPEQDDFEKYWLQCCEDCDKAGVITDEEGKYHWEPGQSPCRIRPSIFMPRWASRIKLEITNVRVERLQDISEEDAIAEGVNVHADFHGEPRDSIYSPVQAYRDLWESINGLGSWDANPWVWVIEFKDVSHQKGGTTT